MATLEMKNARETLACLMIDDPLLRPRYRCLDYAKLLKEMKGHRFFTEIAFIPWNYKRSIAKPLQLFADNTDHYAVCVHGCNHLGNEFGGRNYQKMCQLSSIALWRMEEHKRRTGLHYDPVMVFPQGRFRSMAIKVLKHQGYCSTFNSTIQATDREKLPAFEYEKPSTFQSIMRYTAYLLFMAFKFATKNTMQHNGRVNYVILFALLFACSGISHATTYYVATNGNDNNPGSVKRPLRTIQKAADMVKAGDVALINSGAYSEHVITKTSGALGKPIQFTANGVVSMRGFTINHNYIKVNGFRITGEHKKYDGFITVSGSNNVISNNDITYSGSSSIYGIMLKGSSSHCKIQNNTLDSLVYPNIQLKGSFHIVENNTIKNTPHDAMRVFGNGHIIRGNFFNHVDTTGITHTDIIQTFGASGEVAYDIIFENNYIKDCKAQIGNFEQHGEKDIRDWTFRNNVYENVSIQANIYAPGFKWYNNTFYHVDQTTGGPLLFKAAPKGTAHNGEVINNLFIDCGSKPNNTGWYSVAAGVMGFQADYNYVAKGPSGNWGAKAGFYEKHGINGGNPKLINYETSDFRLQSDSPAIDRGIMISDFYSDKNGIPRPQGSSWDIGAYEKN